jgi:rod shape-determining protein MreC
MFPLINSNKKNKINRRVKVFILVFLLLGLTAYVFTKSPSSFVSETVNVIAKPFLVVGNYAKEWVSEIKSERSVKEENKELKIKLNEANAKILSFDALKRENQELRSFLRKDSEQGENSFLVASIVSKPPQSPYDILVLDVGSEKGIWVGMTVTAYGDVLLGYVVDVSKKTSKVKLISFPQEETNVLLSVSNTPAIAVGLGGENLEIILPRTIEIKSGESIVALGVESLLVGVVEKVEINVSNPLQKIFFRLPINLQELRYVSIEMQDE